MLRNSKFEIQNFRVKVAAFTLIELLIVIAIIGILASMVFLLVNPAERMAQGRNSRRWSDVNTLQSAIQDYIVDHDGDLPTGIDTNLKQIGTCSSGGGVACSWAQDACLDLATDLATYTPEIPTDPKDGSPENTMYSIIVDENGFVTVSACNAENDETISVTK